jgi:hypothetical protein
LVVGLHTCANVEAIEDAFVKKKSWENGAVKSDVLDIKNIQHHGSKPTLEPQVCTITYELQLFCVSALQMLFMFISVFDLLIQNYKIICIWKKQKKNKSMKIKRTFSHQGCFCLGCLLAIAQHCQPSF